jgi:hypothetical protein
MSKSEPNVVEYLADRVRKVPGVAQVEGRIRGAFAAEADLPIAGYDKLTAASINTQLAALSQAELAMLDVYERKRQNRTTVLDKIETLRSGEPWTGYDELTGHEIEKLITGAHDSEELRAVRRYEQAHKARSTVLSAAERRLTHVGG